MKLPRDVAGHDLVRALGRLGYVATRQSGSHIRATALAPKPVLRDGYPFGVGAGGAAGGGAGGGVGFFSHSSSGARSFASTPVITFSAAR